MLFLEKTKLDILLQKLYCPMCQEDLSLTENEMSFVCKGGKPHCLDISASGYVNFALQKSGGGDSGEAVLARTQFLAAGFYEKFARAVCEVTREVCSGINTPFIVDAGCGQGYYTNMIAQDLKGGLVCGVDLSKQAVQAGAKSSKKLELGNAFHIVGGIYQLPFKNESADVIVNLFAPCAEDEFSRVLSKDGYLIVGSAGREHLLQLKKAIYENAYENEERADMPKQMQKVFSKSIKYQITLNTSQEIQNLFAMTPYYYRTSADSLQKLKMLQKLTTTVDFDITVYKKVF